MIKDGKVELKVWLTAKPTEVLNQLEHLAFEVTLDSPDTKLIIGRISREMVEELAKLPSVRFIAPLVNEK